MIKIREIWFKVKSNKSKINLARYIKSLSIYLFFSAVIVGLFILLLWMRGGFGKDIQDYIGNKLIPSIHADLFGIMLTTFFIATLLEKRNKKKENEKIYTVCGKNFEYLTENLIRNYLYLFFNDIGYVTFYKKSKVFDKFNRYRKFGYIYTEGFLRDTKFNAWDIMDSSPIHTSFENKIKDNLKNLEIVETYFKEFDENIKERDYLKFKLNIRDDDQVKQNLISAEKEYDYLRLLLGNSLQSIDKVNPNIYDCSYALEAHFQSEIENFIEKFKWMMPLDMFIILKKVNYKVFIFRNVVTEHRFKNIGQDSPKFKEHCVLVNKAAIELIEEINEMKNYFKKI